MLKCCSNFRQTRTVGVSLRAQLSSYDKGERSSAGRSALGYLTPR